MKKIFLFTIITLFLVSFASAGISLEKNLNDLYNLQDKIELKLQITPDIEFSDFIALTLSCPTGEIDIYKEYLFLTENTTKNIVIPLVKEFIGENKGLCQINSKIGNKSTAISNKFTISNKLKVSLESTEQLIPGKTTKIEGKVLRENGKNANGSIEARIKINDLEEILIKEQVIDGAFTLNLGLPENTKAGERIIKFYAYEKNQKAQITNEGNGTEFISIKQIPTNIEIQLEEKEIFSGETLKFKIILHDQTGEKIKSFADVAIMNEKEEILNQIKTLTEETIEYPIKFNELKSTWEISAHSETLVSQTDFTIKETKKVDVEMINETLILTNKGNVPYNDTLEIKIGEENISLLVYLEINGQEEYLLSAPDGEYEIKIGDFSQSVSLTGNVIGIKKLKNVSRNIKSTIAWILLIIILGFATLIIFKKTYKKNFFARFIPTKKKKEKSIETKKNPNKLTGFINPKIKSDISLSISGSKQNVCIGCISFKNYEEIKTGEGNVRETLQKVINLVEEKKGFMYQNKENLFFILAPMKTKTFKNEQEGVEISDKIKSIIKDHNKIFKQKIEFGISLNYGAIVTKQEPTGIKFMSMGTLLNITKKLANHAKEEIYIADQVKKRLENNIKTEIKNIGTMSIHLFKGIAKKDQHSKFIDGFVARQKKEIAEREYKEKQN